MRTPTSSTDGRAFTLMEVMAVVLILGVVGSLVFPRLDSVFPKHALRSATNEVVGIVATARAHARTTRIEVDVRYDIDKAQIALETQYWPEGQVVPFEANVLMTRQLPRGIRILAVHYGESGLAQDGQAIATFRPSGAVGEHMVELVNEDGDTQSIFVPALLGTPFTVEKGITYAQIRMERRLK